MATIRSAHTYGEELSLTPSQINTILGHIEALRSLNPGTQTGEDFAANLKTIIKDKFGGPIQADWRDRVLRVQPDGIALMHMQALRDYTFPDNEEAMSKLDVIAGSDEATRIAKYTENTIAQAMVEAQAIGGAAMIVPSLTR